MLFVLLRMAQVSFIKTDFCLLFIVIDYLNQAILMYASWFSELGNVLKQCCWKEINRLSFLFSEKFVVPCTCKDRIQNRSHWHCPNCRKIIFRKCNFEVHLSKQHSMYSFLAFLWLYIYFPTFTFLCCFSSTNKNIKWLLFKHWLKVRDVIIYSCVSLLHRIYNTTGKPGHRLVYSMSDTRQLFIRGGVVEESGMLILHFAACKNL